MGGDSWVRTSVTRRSLILRTLVLSIFTVNYAWSQLVEAVPTGPEGYFDGTAYAILKNTLDIRHMTSLDFRTCSSHGLLFHQSGARGDSLQLELVDNGRLRLQWRVTGVPDGRVEVGQNLNNNEWHLVVINYALGAVTLTVNRKDTVVANASYNTDLLRLDLRSPNPEVVIGQGFEGCLLQGASMEFSDPDVVSVGVNWTHCPIPNRGHCDGYQVDFCFSQPCHKHGTCISMPDGYHCTCTTRYSGKNCEIDTGPLCEREEYNRCKSGGVCQEDKTGNITTCACPAKYTGQFCEDLIDSRLCHSNPCLNGGVCRVNSFSDGYECVCLPGFAGTNCENNINECSSSPCEHGGVCIDGIDSYTCNCDGTGYRGKHCQFNINECKEENPCFNGGRCFDSYASYFCECTPGFAGRNCEREANECASQPCRNGATCVKILSRYQCICAMGFQGRDCELNIDDCNGISCPKSSHCVDDINSYSCVCDDGFTGSSPNCTDINECESNPCQNGATCEDQIGQFQCHCPIGFAGNTCSENIDECSSEPCLNGGTCIDGIASYTCTCPIGLLGPNCSKDIDECLSLPCLHGGQCKDKIGGFVCNCVNGWSGANCEFDVDECDSTPCQHGGRCEDKVGNYECHCMGLWSGKNCDINLDPCSGEEACLNNATCLNHTEGNFTCQCLTGFIGQFCELDVDECQLEPCHNDGRCENKIGGYVCHCPSNFGGTNCIDSFDNCIVNPCQHGGSCNSLQPNTSFTCICPEGFAGIRCEININECEGIICSSNQECVDLINDYRCQCRRGFDGPSCELNIDDCAERPCRNNGICVDAIGNFSCRCPKGFTGHRCELDVDECTINRTSPCHRGICVNKNGSFQCYCSQGYTGQLCDHEYDECLSRPCKNGGVCRDLVSNYKCICPVGYTGRNCETEIDECAMAPCLNNATCTDKVGSFNCDCAPGFTGILCEEDIDECISSPCLHVGKCVDKVNGFVCDCDDTGFKGEICQENIDDCISNPCIHDSNCTDQIKNYTCSCHFGFSGQNCEVDVAECEERPCLNGGGCLEKSNHTIYEVIDTLRPAGFPIGPYSYAAAGGYLCTCLRGFTGENCEINIDDCVSHQCQNGVCADGVDAYSCRCNQGFEGKYCEIEIDECRRHRPCSPGSICEDLIGDYRCHCHNGIGGKNCTVPLVGCEQHDCQNGATCIPYLTGEDRHMKNCSCSTGFYGSVCEHSTAISFDGSQKVTIIGNASRDYHLNFRFRTTLPNGLLVFGYGQTHYYLIYLRNASVYLVVENVGNEVPLTRRKVNNGLWWTIRVELLGGGLLFKLSNDSSNEEMVLNKTIDMTSSAVSKPTFTNTVMGGVESWMGSLSTRFNLRGFIGCMEDVVMSGETIVPRLETKKTASAVSVISDVLPNCIRTPQCYPNTCNGGGVCIDLWNNYSCNCHRPYYGLHCEREYESVTFGRGNITDSLIEVNIPEIVSQVLRNDTTVSLFLRTRKGDGLIFYLGNGDSIDGASDSDTFLAAELESGLLRVSVKINGTPESLVDKLGQRLDDGYYHFLQVSLVDRTLSASINDTTLWSSMSVEASTDKYLVASSLYLGGLPTSTMHRRNRRQTLSNLTILTPPINFVPPSQELTPPTVHVAIFKGVLQDVRVNKWMVEFFNFSNEILPRNILQNVSNFNVIAGVQSDDTCLPSPCSNGSTCTVTWNDYHCECAEGFRGKNCTDKEYCAFFACPENSECRSLIDGYECVSNATFNGINSTVILVPRVSSIDTFPSTLTFYYRTQIGGSILHFSDGINSYLDVGLLNATRFKLSWINGAHLEEHEINLHNVNDGDWHFISVISRDRSIFVEVDDDGKTQKISPVADWNLSSFLVKNTTSVVVGQHYRGCLRDVRLGSILLPFLPRSALLNDTSSNYFDALNLDHIGINECQLCYDHECTRKSICLDKYASYQCNCSEGFTGQLCEIDIDECDGVVCANGGSCIDALANFSCRCASGYEGAKCEIEIDECNSNPCQNGGICIDLIDSYNCSCLSNYTGVNCEKEKAFDCSAHPCHRGSTCTDVIPEVPGEAAYQCICQAGFEGLICDTEINFCLNEPCKNGATCINQPHFETFQCICVPGFEGNECAEKVNHCKPKPCHNGGTCHRTDQSYTCSCLPTHTGQNCDEDVDECANGSVCLNNGTCSNLDPGFECLCTSNYLGSNCSYYNECALAPCANGDCTPKQIANGSYIFNCKCEPGYTGQFCDEEDQQSNTQMLAIVVGSVVATTVLIIVVALVVFLTMAKKKRATRGTYSPSRQEMFGSRVEMGNVMKPPPEERLI